MRAVRHTTILLIAVTCWPGWVRAEDVAVLANGDRFTGTAQKLEKGTLAFKTKYSETPLQVDWTLVLSLATDSEVKVTMRDGTAQMGWLVSSDGGIQPSAVVALEPKAAERTEGTSTWLRRALDNSSVSADFDQDYSGLAQYNQLSANSEIDYKGDRWDGTLVTHYDYYGASDSAGSTYQGYGRLTAERYLGGDHFFLFPYAFLGRRTTADGGRGQIRQFGGGAGWTFRRHQSDQVSFSAGVVRGTGTGFTMLSEHQRADVRVESNLFIAAAFWDKTLKSKITTSVRLYYFKPILEPGHNAMATDASAKIPLFGPAYLTFRAYDTPELGQKQLFSVKHLQLSSGIGITF